MAGQRARIALIGCGGTISSLATHATDYVDYPETGRKLSAFEVLERLPDLADLAELEAIAFRAVGSSAIGPRDWLALAQAVDLAAAAKPDAAAFDAVVILHGTATMEETAWFLHLVHRHAMPIVLTGAQRPLNTIGSDAHANLRAAIRVAADPASRGRGVMIVMNDAIWPARAVTKGSTLRLQAFHAGPAGELGVADPDRVRFHAGPVAERSSLLPMQLPLSGEFPRVDVVYAVAGGDGVQARAAVAAGASGIVSAGFAPGMPPTLEREALIEAAAQGVIIVQASRVGSGRVVRRSWLREHGWIAADDLSPQKARIALMLALLATRDPIALQECFDRI